MKKILTVLLTICMVLSTFACTTGKGGTTYDPEGNMILSVWAPDEYAGAEVKAKFESFIAKLNDTPQMKELKVKLKFNGGQVQLPSSLSTACSTGRQPDLVLWDRFATPSNTNILYPLDDFISRDKVDTSKFLPEAFNELTIEKDGTKKQYGLPLDADPWGIYLNMDIIGEYNKDKADADKITTESLSTWTGVMDAANKLTVRDGTNVTRSGLNTTSADGQFFSFVYTGTGELINTDKNNSNYGDTVLVDNNQVQTHGQSKRVYDTLAFFEELYKLNVCNTGHGGTDAFGNGLCAMTYGSLYFPQQLSGYKLKNYKMIPYPARDRSYTKSATVVDPDATDSLNMKNGQVGGMLGGYGLVIPQPKPQFQNAEWKERVEKAWKVINLWLNDDKINEMYFTTNEAITCRSDLLNNEFYQKDGVLKDIIPYLNNYKMRPSITGYEVFESTVVRSQIQSMREGSQTALQTLAKIRDEGNNSLRISQGRI